MRPLALLLTLLAVLATAYTIDAQTPDDPRQRVYKDPLDLDMPFRAPGSQQVQAMPGPRRTPPATLKLWDFEATTGGPDTQGWTTHDLTVDDVFNPWHVDGSAGNLTGGTFGRLVPVSGAQSLWCGMPAPTGGPSCGYATLPGYGNDWDYVFTSEPLPNSAGMDMFVTLEASWDTEFAADVLLVEHRPEGGTWTPLGSIALISGTQFPAVGLAETINYPPPAPAKWELRFRFVSDFVSSDEDGSYDSDGAVIIDNLKVVDAGGVTIVSEDFETEPLGAAVTTSGVFRAETAAPAGDFAALYPGLTRLQQLPPLTPAEVNPTHLWAFVGGPEDYACGGFPGEDVVPFPNTDGIAVNNAIRSEWVNWNPGPGKTTHLKFEAYSDLPNPYRVYYRWRVRQRVAGGCPGPWWSDGFVYYSGMVRWRTHDHDITPLLTPTPAIDEIQVELSAVDLSLVFTGPAPTCHSNAPLLDNVEVYIDNTHSWVVQDADLFQDAFPTDGTGTGTIRADAAGGNDFVEVLVTESGVGMDYLVPNTPSSGPAVFCHVGNLSGKSGAVVSGGVDWPEVPSMSGPDWTVIQMDSGTALNQFTVDLNDALYTPGDVVEFYFSARDANGVTTYWSQFTGRVNTEGEAQAAPMEFTALPANASANLTTVLYVDDFNGWGGEPFFMSSFYQMGVAPDRYDVRAPSSLLGNGPGSSVSDISAQVIQYYDTIIWNTGSLSPGLESGDYQFLLSFLDQHTAQKAAVFLTGDDAGSDWDASTDNAALALRSAYLDFSVPHSDHTAAGCQVSPQVTGEINTPYQGLSLIALGAGPPQATFDVLAPGQNATTLMSYQCGGSQPAMIDQVTQGQNGEIKCFVLAGFSQHQIRDEQPGAPPVRTQLLSTVLNSTTGTGGNPTPAVSPPLRDGLEQNVPNPFNPTTIISFGLRERVRVRLRIYDVRGALVRTLLDEERGPGPAHEVVWDGRDNAGRQVSSGVYFYRMATPGFTQTRKMVLLK